MHELLESFEKLQEALHWGSNTSILDRLAAVRSSCSTLLTELEEFDEKIRARHGHGMKALVLRVRNIVNEIFKDPGILSADLVENLSAIHELAGAWAQGLEFAVIKDDKKWSGKAHLRSQHVSKTDEEPGSHGIAPGLIRGTKRPSSRGGV